MLTYTPINRQATEASHEYPWLLMLLVFAWLWPGVFSHDLWNPQEPALYAVISENSHPFLPTLHGEPYFQAAPIYVWVAAWCRYLLTPHIMDMYAATRFATVLFTVIGLTANGMAAYRFLGKSHGRSTVLILIGSAGLLSMGHFIGTMSVAFASIGLILWGFASLNRQVVWASILMGIGTLLLAQSMGWLIAGCLIWLALLVGLTPQWRNVRYFTTLLGALAIVVPLAILQFIVLYHLNSHAWTDYWQNHLFGAYGGLQKIHFKINIVYYFKNLLWFAFPAYPLAAWTLYRMRGAFFQTRWGILAGVWLTIFGALLAVSPSPYQDNLIILLPILAIIGAAQLDNLRRGVAAFLNWFGIMAFGLMSVFLWIGFVAINYGFPAKLAERAAYFSPFYIRDIDPMPMIVALLFTPAWIFAITRKRIRGRQAVSNWASGMTLAWALLLTLFLPWLDAAKSYRPIVQQMHNQLPPHFSGCLNIHPNHTAAQLAWREYGKFPIKSNGCTYTLIQYNPRNTAAPVADKQIIWQGKRPRQKTEAFVLIKS
ncbi:ArnT family glycosyltransferase [Alysiella crassa]|uniref:Glycosyltransferase RgtA/B/C/D-like domain-containing protein n=1 Tax=Alysiella crassa TaxID=153491 RepID=A0A376BVV2_9NEIS|nr:membrane protein [Alysiella crassa]SSY80971.1 Uncharacterised protein [Alysiella crassa]